MRAIQVRSFGPPEVLALTTVPDPAAGPAQAAISVEVADVLLLDAVIRSGRATQWFPVQPPYVPGNGVAGRVASAGEGAGTGWAGLRVVAHTGSGGGSDGYAQQAVVPVSRLVPVPDGLSMPGAAALLHDGATALGLAAATGIGTGEWVLMAGAAGGIGILLMQAARARGAKVIGAARGEAKLGLVTRLGADAAVDACKGIIVTARSPSRSWYRWRARCGSARSPVTTPPDGAGSTSCWCPTAGCWRPACNRARPC